MTQTNHQLARRFIEALSKGEIPDALLTPDMTAWTTSSGAWSDKARFQYGIRLLASIFNGALAYTLYSPSAEADPLAAEVQSRWTLITGRHHHTRYAVMPRSRAR